MTAGTPIVFVVDDDASIRRSVTRLLGAAGYRVDSFASTKLMLPQQLGRGPCCLVLDVLLPDGDGLRFFEDLIRSGIDIPTVFITGGGDIPMSVRAIKAGAVDFLPKPFNPDQLLTCVKAALERSSLFLANERRLSDIRQRYATLTQREREVFASVTSGMLNKQVALAYGISEKTIKVHRGRVMEKMQVVAFAELVRLADLLCLHGESGRPAETLAAAM